MSWTINKGHIRMTKGDTPIFRVIPKIVDKDGSLHNIDFQEGDTIVFAMRKKGASEIALQRELEDFTMLFKEEDTKNLAIGDYDYEISYNSGEYHCTFIENTLELTREIY